MFFIGWGFLILVAIAVCMFIANRNGDHDKSWAVGAPLFIGFVLMVFASLSSEDLVHTQYRVELPEYKLLAFEDAVAVDGTVYGGIFTFRGSVESEPVYYARVQRPDDNGITVVDYYADAKGYESWVFETAASADDAKVTKYVEISACPEGSLWLRFFFDCRPVEDLLEYRLYVPAGTVKDAGSFNLNLSDN